MLGQPRVFGTQGGFLSCAIKDIVTCAATRDSEWMLLAAGVSLPASAICCVTHSHSSAAGRGASVVVAPASPPGPATGGSSVILMQMVACWLAADSHGRFRHAVL